MCFSSLVPRFSGKPVVVVVFLNFDMASRIRGPRGSVPPSRWGIGETEPPLVALRPINVRLGRSVSRFYKKLSSWAARPQVVTLPIRVAAVVSRLKFFCNVGPIVLCIVRPNGMHMNHDFLYWCFLFLIYLHRSRTRPFIPASRQRFSRQLASFHKAQLSEYPSGSCSRSGLVSLSKSGSSSSAYIEPD